MALYQQVSQDAWTNTAVNYEAFNADLLNIPASDAAAMFARQGWLFGGTNSNSTMTFFNQLDGVAVPTGHNHFFLDDQGSGNPAVSKGNAQGFTSESVLNLHNFGCEFRYVCIPVQSQGGALASGSFSSSFQWSGSDDPRVPVCYKFPSPNSSRWMWSTRDIVVRDEVGAYIEFVVYNLTNATSNRILIADRTDTNNYIGWNSAEQLNIRQGGSNYTHADWQLSLTRPNQIRIDRQGDGTVLVTINGVQHATPVSIGTQDIHLNSIGRTSTSYRENDLGYRQIMIKEGAADTVRNWDFQEQYGNVQPDLNGGDITWTISGYSASDWQRAGNSGRLLVAMGNDTTDYGFTIWANAVGDRVTETIPADGEFHEYSVVIEPALPSGQFGDIVMYIDGNELSRVPSTSWVFNGNYSSSSIGLQSGSGGGTGRASRHRSFTVQEYGGSRSAPLTRESLVDNLEIGLIGRNDTSINILDECKDAEQGCVVTVDFVDTYTLNITCDDPTATINGSTDDYVVNGNHNTDSTGKVFLVKEGAVGTPTYRVLELTGD